MGITVVEYGLAVPEVITLVVFAVFFSAHLGGAPTCENAVGFGLIALGAFFVFKGPPG